MCKNDLNSKHHKCRQNVAAEWDYCTEIVSEPFCVSKMLVAWFGSVVTNKMATTASVSIT